MKSTKPVSKNMKASCISPGAEAIPSVHHSCREEVQLGITTTVGLHQLPTVTTSASTISKLEV